MQEGKTGQRQTKSKLLMRAGQKHLKLHGLLKMADRLLIVGMFVVAALVLAFVGTVIHDSNKNRLYYDQDLYLRCLDSDNPESCLHLWDEARG